MVIGPDGSWDSHTRDSASCGQAHCILRRGRRGSFLGGNNMSIRRLSPTVVRAWRSAAHMDDCDIAPMVRGLVRRER